MPERTSNSEQLDRQTAADKLEDVASELRHPEDVRIRVGNKDIELRPPETVNYSIDVVERSSLLRGDNETVEIELSWKPR